MGLDVTVQIPQVYVNWWQAESCMVHTMPVIDIFKFD